MNTKRSLAEWLSWQEALHSSAIDLGLARIRVVAERLNLLNPSFPIITVAGTNGKGSTVALLNALLMASQYRVGAYTSPHILRYNERVAVNAQAVNDDDLCDAFAAIEAVRGDVSLTYFEYGTLAALWLFQRAAVDVAILEVGLGGRLDATNLWDCDAAIVTGIDLDHVDWLGDNREQIGFEKASIARADKPLICGDPNPPLSIARTASALQAELWQNGVDFRIQIAADRQHFSVDLAKVNYTFEDLPRPQLAGDIQFQNAANALVALYTLRQRLPLQGKAAIERGLQQLHIAGRLQRLLTQPAVWLDVAHNPQAARELAHWLAQQPRQGKTFAIFSLLADKNLTDVVKALSAEVDEWHCFAVNSPRATPLAQLVKGIERAGGRRVVPHANLLTAWQQLQPQLSHADRVVIFGSFLVVSEALEQLFPSSGA